MPPESVVIIVALVLVYIPLFWYSTTQMLHQVYTVIFSRAVVSVMRSAEDQHGYMNVEVALEGVETLFGQSPLNRKYASPLQSLEPIFDRAHSNRRALFYAPLGRR